MKTKRILAVLALLMITVLSFSQTYPRCGYAGAKNPEGMRSEVVSHLGYTVSYNSETLCPNWVAWELTKDETWGESSRTDEFTADPMVAVQADTHDYIRSGYDRGHMAPAADMKWSEKAMLESFYMTNVCPQDNALNAGTWLTLEKKCRGWAKRHGKVWIVCGPVYLGKKHDYIGNATAKVMVPDKFFKVILAEYKPGKFDCIGFLFPNEPCQADLNLYAVSVSLIEYNTGLTFFPSLPKETREEIIMNENVRYWQ